MSTKLRLFGCAATLALFTYSLSAGETKREVKWNNPDGPKNPSLTHASFHSESMDTEIGYNVSLPEGYADGKASYPVIYFLHGAGGNENSDAGGFAGLIARLAKDKKIPPAICVFPNGGMSGYQDRPEQKIMGETLIVKELLPLIDKTYRTKAEPAGRVIAGFSMGGGGAVRLSLKHPELFSAAGSWAGAIMGRNGGTVPVLEPDYLKTIDGKVRLLLIVGDNDMTFNGHKPVIEKLEAAKYPVTYKVLEGVSHNLGAYHEKTGEEMARFLTEKF